MRWRALGGGWRAGAAAFAVASICLLGCGGSGSPPRASVALKSGGELASWSPDGRFIAAPDSGAIDLLGQDGTLVRRIGVPGVNHSTWPCECRLGWSRDGRRILFLTRRGRGGTSSSVGSVGRDGGGLRRVPLGVPAGDAAWSPRGWPLVFVVNSGAYELNTPHRGPKPDLWRLDGLGAKPHPILRRPGIEVRPSFSPDGTAVSYVRKLRGRRSIWVVGVDGSNPHPVTTKFLFASAVWAPNSRRLAVAAVLVHGGGEGLYLASASGGRMRKVPGVSSLISALAWTPNGRWITYGDSEGVIWRIRPNGSGRKRIGEVPEAEIRRLLWSPNGRHLAYAAYHRDETD